MATTFSRVHHVTLTVTDLAASERFYCDVLGFARAREREDELFSRLLLLHESGLMIGLTRHKIDISDEPFNERLVGMDHLALAVDGVEALEAWAAQLDVLGIAHSGVKEGTAGAHLLVLRDPDNIQLEFFAP